MRAAVVRVVQHKHIARLHAALVLLDHRLDALAHRAQMHRHVRRVGNQMAFGAEQRTRKVQTLLDVDRIRRVLQLQPHLLGDVHEQVVEHLQQHRVGLRACGVLHRARLHAHQQQMIECCQSRLPAGFHHLGGIFLGNDGWAIDHVAGAHVFAHHQRRALPLGHALRVGGIDLHRVAARHIALGVHGQHSFFGRIAGQHRLDRHGLNHQSLALHQKSKALSVGGLKPGHQLGLIAPRHNQRRVGAFVAQMRALAQLNAVGTSGLHAHLPQQGLARGLAQSLQALGHVGHGRSIQTPLDGFFAHHVLVGQAHAVSRQHTRQRVHQHLRHAQGIGHQTRMLPARTAKALQGVARHVVTPRHRDFLDRVGHLLHRDLDEAMRHVFCGAPGLCGQFCKMPAHHLRVQRLVRIRPKHRREKLRLHLAHHHVRIGHGQRPAAAVTGWARVGPRALRSHPKTRTVIGQQ